jgi:hypothetical protein
VTPRIFSPSVTDNPKGSRQALLTMRPGWAGFFMGMALSPFSSGNPKRSLLQLVHAENIRLAGLGIKIRWLSQGNLHSSGAVFSASAISSL